MDPQELLKTSKCIPDAKSVISKKPWGMGTTPHW